MTSTPHPMSRTVPLHHFEDTENMVNATYIRPTLQEEGSPCLKKMNKKSSSKNLSLARKRVRSELNDDGKENKKRKVMKSPRKISFKEGKPLQEAPKSAKKSKNVKKMLFNEFGLPFDMKKVRTLSEGNKNESLLKNIKTNSVKGSASSFYFMKDEKGAIFKEKKMIHQTKSLPSIDWKDEFNMIVLKDGWNLDSYFDKKPFGLLNENEDMIYQDQFSGVGMLIIDFCFNECRSFKFCW